jgi:hypothetical protein
MPYVGECTVHITHTIYRVENRATATRAIPPMFVTTARIAPSNWASRVGMCFPGRGKKLVANAATCIGAVTTGTITSTSLIGGRSRPARAVLHQDCCADFSRQFTCRSSIVAWGDENP